ncbi:unnamed protein product, partial [Ectocarpus fasciculatus]
PGWAAGAVRKGGERERERDPFAGKPEEPVDREPCLGSWTCWCSQRPWSMSFLAKRRRRLRRRLPLSIPTRVATSIWRSSGRFWGSWGRCRRRSICR